MNGRMDGRIDGLMDRKKNILYYDSRTGTSKAAIAFISHFTGIFINCFTTKRPRHFWLIHTSIPSALFLALVRPFTTRPRTSTRTKTMSVFEQVPSLLLKAPLSSLSLLPRQSYCKIPIPIHSIKTLFNSSTTLLALFKPLLRSHLSTIFLIQQQQHQHQQQPTNNQPTTNKNVLQLLHHPDPDRVARLRLHHRSRRWHR